MFRPNQVCYILVASGRTDVYGQPLAATRVREQCAIVTLKVTNKPTSIRSEKSATRGAAREPITDSMILLTAKTAAKIDDLIDLGGFTFRVLSMNPRYTLSGTLDHYEVTVSIWN